MKTMFTLLPWGAIRAAADCMTTNEGSKDGKHADSPWRTESVDHHINCALRHFERFHGGEILDPEDGASHLIKAGLRLLMAGEVHQRIAGTDPR